MVIWLLMNFGIYEGAFGLLDTDVDGYLDYSLMAGLGNLLAWAFAPLGFGSWEDWQWGSCHSVSGPSLPLW